MSGPSPSGPHLDDPVGSVIADRYRVLEHLSEGGMASVYLAEHVAVGRTLALKILRGDQSRQPDLLRRFLQEARAASLVRSPHVIDIIDVGVTPDGLAYMAMELLDGEDLSQLLAREGPLPWSRLGPMILQICDALRAAHAQGIVHRDIKPENCFAIEFAGARDFIKVIDFGIAKDLEGKTDIHRAPTVSGSIYGTAAYVAPELLAGKTPDARVDIYALGVLMYELLAGEKPFPGEAISDILLGHLQTLPTPLATKAPGRVPEAVDALVLHALEKDPDHRFQSMEALAEAVAATLDPLEMQRAIEAGTIPTGSYLAVLRAEHSSPALRRPTRASAAVPVVRRPPRRRWLIALALLLVLALGLVLLRWQLRPDERVMASPHPEPAARREAEPADPPTQPAGRALPPITLPAPARAVDLAPPVDPPPPGPTTTDAARPIRLTAAVVQREIQREIGPRARACLTHHTRLIKGQQFPVQVEIRPNGEARATATLASSPAARCIADLFQRHRFPANIGGLTLEHRFSL
jgi:serine/threonine-protein kinase